MSGYLKPYHVDEDGVATTLMLTDRDAAARGMLELDEDDVESGALREGGPLRQYTVTEDGAETTVLLDDRDAVARGLLAEEEATINAADLGRRGDETGNDDAGQRTREDVATSKPPAKKAAPAKKAPAKKAAAKSAPISVPDKHRTRSGRRGAAAANTGKPSSSKA